MNREPIYPLPKREPGDAVPRSANERLHPIFEALADDPDGYSIEVWDYDYADWIAWYGGVGNMISAMESAHTHDKTTMPFRLVPKQKYVTVTIPVPQWAWGVGIKTNADGSAVLPITYRKRKEAVYAREAISKAMEEQG